MSVNSRQKGKVIELQAAQQVRQHWHAPDCIRAAQANGKYSCDLLNAGPGLHVEVKGYKAIGAMKFMRQAERDAGKGETPVVLMRENGDTEFVVMMRVSDAVSFAESLASNLGQPIYPLNGATE